ncbi:MAG: cysteine dioxygenase [Rhodanobacter sp.]
MGQRLNTLKALREVALEHASVQQPDLACMARELERVVRQNQVALMTRLGRWCRRDRVLEHRLLSRRNTSGLSMTVVAWPANHRAPAYDQDGRWELQLTLVGTFEVQTWSRDPASGGLRELRHDWLGPGDSAWFDREQSLVHRCRNLSQHETALTLHLYGGNLGHCFAGDRAQSADTRKALPRQRALAGCLTI